MPLPIIQNIFKKPPSTPLTSWIFKVEFYDKHGVISMVVHELPEVSCIPIKIDLPTFETHTVTQKFFGTEKTFKILRKNSGETSLEFNAFSTQEENYFVIKNFFKKVLPEKTDNYRRIEFMEPFEKIKIHIYDNTSKTVLIYVLMNCIVTKIDQGSLSYETEDKLRFTMNVHYDDWFREEIEENK